MQFSYAVLFHIKQEKKTSNFKIQLLKRFLKRCWEYYTKKDFGALLGFMNYFLLIQNITTCIWLKNIFKNLTFCILSNE